MKKLLFIFFALLSFVAHAQFVNQGGRQRGSGGWPLSGSATFTDNITLVQAGFNVTFTGTGRVTFSPSATQSGFNTGKFSNDPSGAIQGDIWVNTLDNNFKQFTGGAVFNMPRILPGAQGVGRLVYHAGNTVNAEFTESANLFFSGTGLLAGGGTITANTRIDIRGTGTSTNNSLRIADSGNNPTFLFLDNGDLQVTKTVTAGGTTGAQTINKLAGTVNFAAAATTLVVTNSLVTANSIVLCTVRTNDATAILKNVVPGAGSFTITLNAAATAETSVGFVVIN